MQLDESLPSAVIEEMISTADVLDSVGRWLAWGIASYPMYLIHKQSPPTLVRNDSDVKLWADKELRSKP